MTHLFQSLRIQLFLLVVLPLLPLFLLAVHSYFELRHAEVRHVKEDVFSRVQLASANQEGLLEQAQYLLAALAQVPQARATNVAQSRAFLIGLLKLFPDFLNFGIISTNGTVLCSALPISERVDLSDRIYFVRAVETRDFVVGEYQVGHITGRPSINFAHAVKDQTGTVVSVIYAALDSTVVAKTAARVSLPPGAVLTIIDRAGRVVARIPDGDVYAGKLLSNDPFVSTVLSVKEGLVQMPGLDGRDRFYAFAPIGPADRAGLFASVGIPADLAFATANSILVRNMVGLLIIGVLALVLARSYADRSILRPIRSLASAAQRFAEGAYSTRCRTDSSKELGQLANAFNDMATQIEARQTQIDGAYRKISELNEDLERRVRNRTAQIELVNQELEAFSYSVSHDLRAPVRHMMGFARVLQDRAGHQLDEEAQRHLRIIIDAAKKMGRLIDDLLAFSRISRQALRSDVVDMSLLVNEVIQTLQSDTAHRLIEWKTSRLPQVFGDAQMLRQVWVNLLSNAVKYTRTRSAAQIEVAVENAVANEEVFFVRDNGVGFQAQYAHKLFGVFQRLHREEEFEGTGIGLAHVRRIVVRHGGRVWAESAPDRGATFYFSIPKEKPLDERKPGTDSPG